MASPTVPSATVTEELLEECINLLKKHEIKLVAFDMDLTAVAQHSRGRLRREDLDGYLSKATPAFRALVPKLYQNGIQLSIATHSDEAEFGGEIQRATHILGQELATALVEHCFSPEIAAAFCIIAYNPRVHPEDDPTTNKIKRFHIRKLKEYFGIEEPSQIIFFDDTTAVVDDCRDTCGVHAFAVDPELGFQLRDLLDNMRHIRVEKKKIKVLTVGEGDLTLSLGLARAYGMEHVELTASVLEASPQELMVRFPDAPLDELRNRNVQVLFGVDATQLHTDRFPRPKSTNAFRPWDLVCFHHPHLGQQGLMDGREGAHAKFHHELLCHYLYSASQVSKLVHLCLCGTQPETWKLILAAEKQGLTLVNQVSTTVPFARVWSFSRGTTQTSSQGDSVDDGICNDNDNSNNSNNNNNGGNCDIPQAAPSEPHFPAPRKYRSGKLGSRHFLSKYGYRHRRTEGDLYKGIAQDMNVSQSIHFVFSSCDSNKKSSCEATGNQPRSARVERVCSICGCSFETKEDLRMHLLAPARPEFTRRKSSSTSPKPDEHCQNYAESCPPSDFAISGDNNSQRKELMSCNVPDDCSGKRLRWFLQHKTIKGLSKRKAGAMVQRGDIVVNGQVARDDSRILLVNDSVTILQDDSGGFLLASGESTSALPEIEVHHRSSNDEWIVVWKPAGMRNKGQYAGTLETSVSNQEKKKYYSCTQMESSSPGFCILSMTQKGDEATSLFRVRYIVTALVHGEVPEDWYPSKSFLTAKGAKWREKKRQNKRKHSSHNTGKSEEQPEQVPFQVWPKETTLRLDGCRADCVSQDKASTVLTTVQVETPGPLSGTLCQFFRQSGFPVVGDKFCRTEYWTLKRSIRNRLKDKLCMGCYGIEIDLVTDSNTAEQSIPTIKIEKQVPERLSANYWEHFLNQEASSPKGAQR